NIEDPIGIDIKGDFNLRDTPGGWRNAGQFKLAQQVVVLGHCSLSLHPWLVIRIRGECLSLLGRDCGVAFDQDGHDTASCLDTKGEGKILEEFLDLGNPGGAANQHNVVHLGFIQLGIPQRLLHGVQRATEQVGVQLFEARPGDGRVEVDALVEGVDLDAGLSAGGQGALSPLAGSAQAPDGPLVLAYVLLVLALELGDEMVDHAVVEVFTPQVGVPCRRFHFKDAVFNGQDGDVECAAAQIKDEHHHGRNFFRIKAFGFCFVFHLDFGPAGIVHDCEGPMLHVRLDYGICLLTKNCVCGIHCHLILCSIANQPLSICERHIAWCGPVPLVIGDDFHLAMLEDANTGIGGAQINPNRWSLRH
ncbi:putative NAD-specific glutamate dehydrogenase protein, partial [Naja naja]